MDRRVSRQTVLADRVQLVSVLVGLIGCAIAVHSKDQRLVITVVIGFSLLSLALELHQL